VFLIPHTGFAGIAALWHTGYR